MHSALALLRASYLTAASYRMALILSFVALFVSVVPIYFISGALQPVVAGSIATEGGQYFGFLIVGLAGIYAVTTAVGALPGAIAGNIGNGTLEALLVTRTPLHHTLLGMIAYPLAMGVVRAMVLVVGGTLVGVDVSWSALPLAALVFLLLVIAYLGFGLIAAALVLIFRTSGPLVTAVTAGSGLLGGVYYSTTVIPAWLQDLSAFVPLTYGLRAMRMLLLGGAPLVDVLHDISVLTLMATALFVSCSAVFLAALRYARTAGTLSQY